MRCANPAPGLSLFPGVGRTPKLVSACHGATSVPLARPGSGTRRRLEVRREELEEGPLHTLRGTLPGSQRLQKIQPTTRSPLSPLRREEPHCPAHHLFCGRRSSPPPAVLLGASAPASDAPSQPRPFYKCSVAQRSAGRDSALPVPARPVPALPCPAPPSSLPFPLPRSLPMLQGPATPAGGTHPGDSLGLNAGRGGGF